MFQLSKKKVGQEQRGQPSVQDKVAAGIVEKCIRVQWKWADYLQRKTEILSPGAKKYGLALFCLLSMGGSFYLVRESFSPGDQRPLFASPIPPSLHYRKTGEESTRSFLLITKDEFQRMKRFRHYIDSLSRSASGQITRDSLLSLRPGLMDSLQVIERLYQLQSSKK
jgi:hypothetical protein